MTPGFYRAHGKRWLDLALAIPALVLLAPLFALIALLVRLQLGAPVLFRQTRAGRDGEPFQILKFRTMTEARDEYGNLRADAERLTPFGRALRSTSLDELPELVNVLRGEMSVVGPRPLFIKYLPRYSKEQRRRHQAPPGITGWTQVNGRNALSWQQKFAFDVWYIEHQSLGLDLKILAMTMRTLIRREGISEPAHATTEEFLGN